jgi:hypothetical protein
VTMACHDRQAILALQDGTALSALVGRPLSNKALRRHRLSFLPLQNVAALGKVSRDDFILMTGLEKRVARRVVSRFGRRAAKER